MVLYERSLIVYVYEYMCASTHIYIHTDTRRDFFSHVRVHLYTYFNMYIYMCVRWSIHVCELVESPYLVWVDKHIYHHLFICILCNKPELSTNVQKEITLNRYTQLHNAVHIIVSPKCNQICRCLCTYVHECAYNLKTVLIIKRLNISQSTNVMYRSVPIWQHVITNPR